MTAPDPKVAELVERAFLDGARWGVGFEPEHPLQQYSHEKAKRYTATALERLGVERGGERERIARIIDPASWAFYERHIANPIMGAECRLEVGKSLAKADAILAALTQPTEPRETDDGR